MSLHRIFEAETIAANTSITSESFELHDDRNVHGLQYNLTGDGTFDLTVYTSIDGQNWISNGIKANNITKTSGPESDGNDIIDLILKPGDHIKVKATEVGTTDSGVLSLWFTQK